MSIPDDAALFAEIGRNLRRRLVGVYIALVGAALLSLGVVFSVPMMHGGNPVAAEGTIVAVEKDAAGETWMTSEFTDARGATHRDRKTQGYHYASGPPVVGQRIEYFYERKALTGDMDMYPRGDRILQWAFGAPMAFLLLFAALAAWFLVNQHQRRRQLVRTGRREIAQAVTIRHRTLVFPTGNRWQELAMWRLDARYYGGARGGFVDCHSDWQAPPAPDLDRGTPLPPILVDPDSPGRYWWPVGVPAAATSGP